MIPVACVEPHGPGVGLSVEHGEGSVGHQCRRQTAAKVGDPRGYRAMNRRAGVWGERHNQRRGIRRRQVQDPADGPVRAFLRGHVVQDVPRAHGRDDQVGRLAGHERFEECRALARGYDPGEGDANAVAAVEKLPEAPVAVGELLLAAHGHGEAIVVRDLPGALPAVVQEIPREAGVPELVEKQQQQRVHEVAGGRVAEDVHPALVEACPQREFVGVLAGAELQGRGGPCCFPCGWRRGFARLLLSHLLLLDWGG